ncbi:570_t:CDS:2, partial [Racocetra persica]
EKSVKENCNEFKEIIMRWFEVDDDYDLLTDLVTEVDEKRYLFVSKNSIDEKSVEENYNEFKEIIMRWFEVDDDYDLLTDLVMEIDEKREKKNTVKKQLGIYDVTRAKELKILLTNPEHAKVKIDDFIEDLKSQRVEFKSSESSTEEINDGIR